MSGLAMPRRGLNDRLLFWSVAGLALLGVGIHLLHVVQFERHARTLLLQAEDAENAGDLERTATHLSRYLQFAPDDAGATARYAELLDRAADSPAKRWRVLEVLRQALTLDPTRYDLRHRFVARAMEAAVYAEAAKHLEILLRANPADVDSATRLGRCLEAQGEFDRAATAYEGAIQLDSQSVEACLRLASSLLKRDQPWKADEVVERLVEAISDNSDSVSRSWKAALDGSPNEIATALVCVTFWARCGGPHAAAALVQLESLEQEYAPGDQFLLLGALARAYHRLGHFAAAERIARRAADRAPADLASQVAWMDAALDAGRADVVESLVPPIRRLEGEGGTWWRFGEAGLAWMRGDKESRERARQLLVELASLRRGWSRLALLEARLDEQDGNPERALDNWVRCIERGDVRPALVYQVSRRLVEWGRFEEADAVIARLQRHAKPGREFAASELMRSLLAKDKDNPAYLARYVGRLLDRQAVEEARIWMSRLEKMAPDGSMTLQLRRRLGTMTGDAP
jgi:tetratricopeptide (TPR) repeat protein